MQTMFRRIYNAAMPGDSVDPPSNLRRLEDRHSPGGDALPEDDTDPFVRPRSPCEISNDPDGASGSHHPLATCNITKYICEDEDELTPYELSFYYDVYAFNEFTESEAIPFVEEAIMRETAEALGVDDCRMFFSRRRLRRLQSLTPLGEAGAVLGLEGSPVDALRQDDPICASTVDEADLSDASCFAVEGGFTLFTNAILDATETAAMREQLLGYIENRMELDAFVVSPYIQKVVYMGEKIEPSAAPTTAPPSTAVPVVPREPSGQPPQAPSPSSVGELIQPDPGSGEWSGTTKGLVYAGGGLLLLIIFALFGASRRRAKPSTSREVAIIEDVEFDVSDTLDAPRSPKALANKDSLALLPQHLLEEGDGETPATKETLTPLPVASIEDDEEEEDDASFEDIMNSDTEEVGDLKNLSVGGALSSIEENNTSLETGDDAHYLDFEDAASTSMLSVDTKSSARRVLQMT
jgi:hypothetical protein